MPPPANPLPLPDAKRQFLTQLLDILVRQLAWPEDADWETPGTEDPDPEDDMFKFAQLRIVRISLLCPLASPETGEHKLMMDRRAERISSTLR